MADVLNFLPNTDLYNNGIDYLRGKTEAIFIMVVIFMWSPL